jgi:hypothetical protein
MARFTGVRSVSASPGTIQEDSWVNQDVGAGLRLEDDQQDNVFLASADESKVAL